jgi:flagellum-specific peptidoglycan hydrolase FlgJ
MAGFLLADDAAEARKNVFDNWLDEQKRAAADAAAQVQQTAQAATQAAADQVAQRSQQFDQWLASQQPQEPPPQPAPPPPSPIPMPTALPAPTSAPATPEAQQRASAFDDWVNQRKQDVANVTNQLTVPQHDPSPPLQTAGTQMANTPGAGGQVFPLPIKPDNAPTATYHSQGGSDLMAPRGTPVLNMQSGTVQEVFTDNGSHQVGGNAVLIHGDDGLDYYYAHFDQPSSAKVGQRVGVGEQIGAVGNSGNAYKGGQGDTHLHVGIGHGISNGVGSEGGLGQNFNAQSLLTDLQAGVGQAAPARQANAEAGPIDASSVQSFARSFAPYAQYAAQALGIDPTWVTAMAGSESNYGKAPGNELFGVKGAGNAGSQTLATHEGEYGGTAQNAGFAAYQSPLDAVNAWVELIKNRYKGAVGAQSLAEFVHGLKAGGYFTAAEPEYLGIVQSIANRVGGEVQSALSQGQTAISGATSAVQNAGQNALDTLGQGAQTVADRAQQLADESTRLAQESGRRAQQAQDLLTQTRQTANADNERYFQQQDARRQQQTNDLLQPRQFDLSMAQNQAVQPMRAGQYGFTAPDLSGVGDALGGVGRAIGGGFDQLGRTVSSAFQEDPEQQRRSDEARQALHEDLQNDPLGLGTAALLKGQQARLEQRGDTQAGEALAETIIRKAKDAGWQPDPQQEQAVRTGLSTITPMNVLMTVALGPEGASARGLVEAGAFLGLSGVGASAGEAVAPSLPESLRPYAPTVGSLLAPAAGNLVAAGARGALRAPETQRFLRDESGELRIGNPEQRPPEEAPNAAFARLAEQAASEEPAAEKVFSGPIADRLEQVGQQAVTPAEVEDARQALAQLASRGDRTAGVPQQSTTPEGLAQLRARLRVLAEEGASQKDWYSDSSHSILEAAQGNKQDAEKLAQLVAIYSPNTPVNTNMNNALQAWHQWKAGDPIKVAMGAQDERASRLLYDGVPWEGRKTNNFYRNLMQHIDPEVYAQMGKETGQSGVTADIWMMRAFDYLAGPNQEGRRWIKAPSDQQYNFIQDEIARLGKDLGWTPEQTQAAVWSSTKAAAEGTGITEAGFHYGTALEQRTAQVSYTASPGSSEAQRVPGYMDAPEHERAAYNVASESGFLDPVTGRDQAAEAAGILRGRTLDVPEVYGGYVGPSLQAEVPVPAAKGSRTEKVLDAAGNQVRDAEGKLVAKSIPIREAAGLVFAPARAALNAFAAFRGKILKQDAVPWTRVFTTKSPLRDANLNQLHIGRPLTTDEAQQLNQALIAQLGGDGKHAVVSTADGAWILNLQGEFERDPLAAPDIKLTASKRVETGELTARGQKAHATAEGPFVKEENIVGTWRPSLDESGKPLPFADNSSFNKAVEEAVAEVKLSGDPDAHVSPFRADGEYVFNDWEANPNGEGYQSQIESSGRADAFAAVEAAITRRVRKAQADAAARFGWPADPNNPFSGTAGAGAVGERGLPGATGAESAAAVGPRAPPEGAGFTAPAPATPAEAELPTTAGADIRGRLRDVLGTSQEGSVDPRFAMRVGGALAGGYAGNATTPEGADPLARYAHIGAGALTGAFAPGLLMSAIHHTGPSAAELEALRPRLPVQGPPTASTVAGKVTEYGKGNLLSGITTHLSNIISQGVELARQPIVRTAAGYEDEAAHGIKSAAAMMPTALERFGNAMGSGRSIYADHPGVTNHPFLRLLTATDDFFRTLGESMGRGMEARRVLNEAGNPTSAAQVRSTIQGATDRIVGAGNRASSMTVFGEGASTGLGKWISDQKNRLLNSPSAKDKTLGLLFDATVPFSSIPDRLWTAGIMRSPGVNEVGQLAKAGYNVAHGDARGARMALSEAAVGSVVNATILSQLANGNITGPDDPEHPNSIKMGGTWVDYSGWGPYALPIAIPAAIMESVQKTGNAPDAGTMQYAAAMSKAVTKTLLNQSYLGSFLKMAGQLGRGDLPGAVGQLGGGYIDRFVPASGLLNQVEQSFDRNLRDIDVSRPWEREASRIPGLSQFLPYKVSPTTGEPAVRPRGSPLGTLFRAETEETDPLKHELARLDRLGYTTPDLKDYPDSVSWHGTEIKLRPDEQRAITAQLGRARADLAAEITSPSWDRNKDDEKALFIKRQMDRISSLKTQAWLDKVDPADAERRLNEAERVAGRLVQGRR